MIETKFNISSFALKIIAIAGMACSHFAYIFASLLPDIATIILYSLGGFTFPIMAFLISEGFVHTSNAKRYASRLFAFALVSQIPYSLLWGAEGNVLFTLLAGLLILWAYNTWKNTYKFVMAFVGLLTLSALCDWGVLGPLLIFLFYYLRGSGWKSIVLPMMVLLFGCGIPAVVSAFQSVLSPILWGDLLYKTIVFGLATLLMLEYCGKRGRSPKWLFYIFYPAHLCALWILQIALLG